MKKEVKPPKVIMIGTLCLLLPIITIGICNNITIFNGAFLEILKGFLIGASFISLLIFIGITYQDRCYIKGNMQLMISSILGVVYCLSLLISIIFMNIILSSDNAIIMLISGVYNILVITSFTFNLIATIFTVIGTVKNNYGFALAGAIMSTISLAIPMMVLGYIGCSRIKNQSTYYHDTDFN